MFERSMAYLRGLARRRQIRSELDDELRFHLDQHIEANITRGMSPAEAARQARLEFGGLEQNREAVEDIRAIWLESVWRDLQLAGRLLRKQPVFSATVGATIAVCLGAHAAVFTVVDQVLLRPLRIAEPDRIVVLGNRFPKAGVTASYNVSAGDYIAYLRQTDVFEEQALFRWVGRTTIDQNGRAASITTLSVTPSFFRLARVTPILGRTFSDEEAEPGRDAETVLSFATWQSRFGLDPSVIGRRLRIDDQPYAIVGVMPRGFALAGDASAVDLWTPMALTSEQRERRIGYNSWGYLARLKEGVSIEKARAEIEAVNRVTLESLPQFRQLAEDSGFYTAVEPFQDALVKDVRPALRLMWGGALFVLLIGALNVANLTLARVRGRTKELATRRALGGGPARIARQLIAESLLLTTASGFAAVMFGWAGLQALGKLSLQQLPGGDAIHIDGRTIGVTLLASAIIGLCIGLLAAVGSLSAAHVSGLRDPDRSVTSGIAARAVRRGLVVAQVAFACVLLLGAGLLLASFKRVLAIDPGFQSDRVLTAQVNLPASRYSTDSRVQLFVDEVLTRVRSLPSVRAAGVTDSIPLGFVHNSVVVLPEGQDQRTGESSLSPAQVHVSPGYMEAMRVRLVGGRFFDDRDVDTAPPVAIVDQTLAARFWPGVNPLGQRLHLAVDRRGRVFTVVGVVAPMKLEALVETHESVGAYFFPIAQERGRGMTFAVRTDSTEPTTLSRSVIDAIQSVDHELPVVNVYPMEHWTAKSLATRRATMVLALIFGGVAVFLAVIGLYGVLAYLIANRRKEIAIRLALGATARAVAGLVMREGFVVTAMGLGLGALGLVALRGVLASQLIGVSVADPFVLGVVFTLLASVAAIGCAIPAWRASLIDPRGALSE